MLVCAGQTLNHPKRVSWRIWLAVPCLRSFAGLSGLGFRGECKNIVVGYVYFRPRTAIGKCVDDFQAYAVAGCKS